MKSIKENLVSILLCFLVFSFLTYIVYIDDQTSPEEKESHLLHNRCLTNTAGSRPYCWKEADWEVFCQKVECKGNQYE